MGKQESLWTLDVSVPSAELTDLIGSPEIIPNSIQMSVLEKPKPNVLRFELGVFEPTNELRFALMTVNTDHPTINVSTSLKGLPKPKVSTSSLTETLAERFLPPTAVAIALIGLLSQRRPVLLDVSMQKSLLRKALAEPMLAPHRDRPLGRPSAPKSALALGAVSAGILRACTIYPRLFEMIPWL